MRFKKLVTPLLITVIICATLALGYQQDPLRRGLPNPFSGAAVRSERLEGIVVSYDALMSLRTSQADFVVKLETSDGKKYIRLRYPPPESTFALSLPKLMFSDGSVVWIFQAHSPRSPEESGACTGQIKRYLPGKDGLPVEVERFASVPGKESEIIPKPESLPCLILENWTMK